MVALGWIKALSFAALEEEAPDIEEDYQLLGLSSSANPPASEVSCHPLYLYEQCLLTQLLGEPSIPQGSAEGTP